MRSKAEPGWWLWTDVPETYTGIWRVTTANGWHYIGAFARGAYLCSWTCRPEMDDDTKEAYAALMETTIDCSEPRGQRAVALPVPPRVRELAFPLSRSLVGA